MKNITSHLIALDEVLNGNWENNPGYEVGKLYYAKNAAGQIGQVVFMQFNVGDAAGAAVLLGSPVYPVIASGIFQNQVSDDADSSTIDVFPGCVGIACALVTDLYYGFMQVTGVSLMGILTDGNVTEGSLLLADIASGQERVLPIAYTQAVDENSTGTYTIYNAGNPNLVGTALADDASSLLVAGKALLNAWGLGMVLSI